MSVTEPVPPLQFVTPEDHQAGLNFLIYGPPGTGKTTLACSGPGPVLFVNAEAPYALNFARQQHDNYEHIRETPFLGVDTFKALVPFIQQHEHEIGTVVLDTVGEAHKILLNEMVDSGRFDTPTQQHYGIANNVVERFSRWMLARKPVFVLVCHEQINTDQLTGNMMRMPSTGGKALPPLLSAMVDVVGYTGVSVKGEEFTYYTNFVGDPTKYGKDRTNKLGANRVSNISRWIAIANGPVKVEQTG